MKKTLTIIGISALAGAAAGIVWYKLNKRTPTITHTFKYVKEDTHSSEPITTNDNTSNVEDNISSAKNAAASTILTRHQDAAQIIQDAVEMIYSTNDTHQDTQKELNQISGELDELLNEE